MKDFTFIDLFCGIGGFHLACAAYGGRCVFASDTDERCREVYFENFGMMPQGDIREIKEEDIPPHDLLCAGFPCQPFSKAGKREGFQDETKGTLFFDILRIIRHHRPKWIVLENVRNLATHDKGNTWRVIRESLWDEGYMVADRPIQLNPLWFGVPQDRDRAFIIAVRVDVYHFLFQDRTTYMDYNKYDLDDLLLKDVEGYNLSQDQIDLIDLWGDFVVGLNTNPPTFPVWSEYLCPLGNIEQFPKWKQSIIKKNAELYESNKEFIDRWLKRAKSVKLFFGAKAKLEWQAGIGIDNIWDTFMQFRPSGLRVRVPNSFPTLVALNQTPIVGKHKRFLTPRECARLQSFPDTFICDENDRAAYKQFGNAVNVECAKFCLKFIVSMSREPDASDIKITMNEPEQGKELELGAKIQIPAKLLEPLWS